MFQQVLDSPMTCKKPRGGETRASLPKGQQKVDWSESWTLDLASTFLKGSPIDYPTPYTTCVSPFLTPRKKDQANEGSS